MLKQETKNWLGTTHVSKIQPEAKTLITIDEETSIEKTLKLLAKHQILSVPVMNEDTLKGFVDIYEIMAYTAFSEAKQVDWKKPASELLGTMGNIVDDDVNGVWLVKEGSSLYKPLEWLSKGVRRFLVETESSGWRLVSQSDMVKFLWKNWDKFQLGEITIDEAKIVNKPVLRADTRAPAIDCFKRMRVHEVNGIAITDSSGSLVGTLSESDLRGLTPQSIERLHFPVIEFLKIQNLGVVPEVLTVRSNTPLRELMETICKKKKHRLFIVDDKKQLVGIVTLSDIIAFFWSHTMLYWFSTE